MGATTTHGIVFKGDGESFWPANETSEEIADSIDAAITAAAGSATSGGAVLPAAPTFAAPLTDYPLGVSIWTATTGGGWPVNGLLITRRHSTTGRSIQELTVASVGGTNAPTRYVRYWGTGPAWSPWLIIANPVPLQQPVQDTSDTDLAISNTTYSTGSPIVGVTFTGPASGAVYVNVFGFIASNNVNNYCQLAYAVKTGTTIGSGTDVVTASNSRAISTSQVVVTGANATAGASLRVLHTDLTPGSNYNAYTVHRMVPGGSGDVFYRLMLVEPVLI